MPQTTATPASIQQNNLFDGWDTKQDQSVSFSSSERGANDKDIKGKPISEAITSARATISDFDTNVWAVEWNESQKWAIFRTKKADGTIPSHSFVSSPGWSTYVPPQSATASATTTPETKYGWSWEEKPTAMWAGNNGTNYMWAKNDSAGKPYDDCKKACAEETRFDCLGYEWNDNIDTTGSCALIKKWTEPGKNFRLKNGVPDPQYNGKFESGIKGSATPSDVAPGGSTSTTTDAPGNTITTTTTDSVDAQRVLKLKKNV